MFSLNRIKRALKPYSMAILSVFIAIFSINAVSLISMAGKSEISRELDGVGLNGMSVSIYDNYNHNITDINLYNILKSCEEVQTLTPVLYDYARVSFDKGDQIDSMCWGISPTAEKIVNLERLHGRMLKQSDIDNGDFVCMVDENVALAAYGRSNITGKNLYITIDSGVYKFEIIGVVNKSSSVLNGLSGELIPNFIYIPFTTMEKIYHKENLDQILINVADETIDEEILSEYIVKNLRSRQAVSIKISNLSRQRDTINNIVEIAFLALFAVSCVAIVVCSISVATSVNTAVSSAKHDIGIKISIGARKTDIMLEFLLYSVFACIIGIVLGTLAGFLLLITVNTIIQTAYSYDLRLLIWGISATIFLTIVFSLYPSRQAASLPPVKALSRE